MRRKIASGKADKKQGKQFLKLHELVIFSVILLTGLLIGSMASGQTVTACNDGIDNDGDNRVDYRSDPGCSSKKDTSELNAKIACDDGIDNDGDGKRDYPSDTGCQSLRDSSERGPKACDNGKDDDKDGMVDYPNDPGCESTLDNDEKNTPLTQCMDKLDNDNDGAADYPNDPGCSSQNDNSEKGTIVCDNSYDDDLDTKVDYPADGDCSGPADPTEYGTCSDSDFGFVVDVQGNVAGTQNGHAFSYADYCADSTSVVEYYCGSYYKPSSNFYKCTTNSTGAQCFSGACVVQKIQCNDGVDNDGDGKVDYPNDPGCIGLSDTTEDDPIQNTCSDSDFGFNIHVQGMVNGTLNGQSFSNTDYCIGNDVLVEYQCYNNGPYTYEYTCQANESVGPYCVEGACV